MQAMTMLSPALDSLPRVFTLSDLKQLQPEEAGGALDTVLRWLEAGVVKQVAPPRPVFYKVVLGEPLTDEDRCRALLRAFPSLVMVAGSALECCVAETELSCHLPDVRLHWRPPAWWSAIRRAGGMAGDYHGVPMLNAELVLADASTFSGVWMPDRESVDWDRLSTARLSEASDYLRELRPR